MLLSDVTMVTCLMDGGRFPNQWGVEKVIHLKRRFFINIKHSNIRYHKYEDN